MSGRSFHSDTSRTALVGILTAGSMALLWIACLLPTGRMGIDAVAGLFPMVAVLAAGRSAGYFCWAATSILGLIMLPDKGIALLYLLFFGLYPVLKERFEAVKNQMAAWMFKLLYFNAVLLLFWFVFRAIFVSCLPGWLEQNKTIFVFGNFVFIAYDIGLSRLIFGLFGRFGPFSRKRK